ncbi:MAG TPA: phosphopantothenoylcysteine decarboxylase [Verrucomicrobiae bacterium]|nr:phosphopantothenoylcysteine decarboxylase [Verrucomicrobiae bacterium]
MRCIVTAGPTFEPLDAVRRLTNMSTGRLGSELGNFLASHGHEVTLLAGQQATWRGERRAQHVETFTTTADLQDRLRGLSSQAVDAVFHVAAVSDFSFGKVWRRSPEGELVEVRSRKFSTREGALVAELMPTPKVISALRDWFPRARLMGWKYEVEGDRASAVRSASDQLRDCRTDGCVANGPGYGPGFGLVNRAGQCEHLEGDEALFAALERWVSGDWSELKT